MAAPLTFIASTFALGLRQNDSRGLLSGESRILSPRSGSERLTRRSFACAATFCSSGTTRALISYFLISNSCAKAIEESGRMKMEQKKSFFIMVDSLYLADDSILSESCRAMGLVMFREYRKVLQAKYLRGQRGHH